MNFKDVFIRLMKMMGKRLYLYLGAIIFMSVGSAGFTVLSSYILKNIIEAAQTNSTEGLFLKITILIISGITLVILARQCTIIYNVEANRAIAVLEKKVFAKSTRLPMSYYEDNHSGDFMSKLIYDTIMAGQVYGSRFRRLVMPMLVVIFYIVPMFILSWQITLGMLVLNIITLLINRSFIEPMKNVSKELSKNNGVLTEKLTNILGGIELSKIFDIGSILNKKFDKENKEFVRNYNKQGKISSVLESLNQGFGFINDLILLALGIYFVGNGTTEIGSLAALYAIKGVFIAQFMQMGIYLPELANCLTNAQNIFKFLDESEEPEILDYGNTKSNGYINFDKVSFSYNKNKKIIDEFSLKIDEGKSIALTGESGKGKSTIAKLLLGFYPIESGNIHIDGKSFSEYKLHEIRNMIAYIPQEPYLYEVSIAENISVGKPGSSIDEIMEVAKTANAHEFILKLEKGYDTIVGERGNKLSGGEKQRIAIARAILKNAPILLMDEATSALDNESEMLVTEAIDRLMEGRTTIMIAHRPSTIARADIVVTL